MTKDELQRAFDEQAAALTALQARLADAEAGIAPVVGAEFPRVVYKAQAVPDPKQIDHPGFDALRVSDADSLEVALADGWTLKPTAA